MSFKNAIKLLCSKFSLVWSTLLFLAVTVIIVVALAAGPVIDMYEWLVEKGFVEDFVNLWNVFVQNGNFVGFLKGTAQVLQKCYELFVANNDFILNITMRMVFLLFILLKFLITTFENALTRVIQSFMSDNAKSGIFGAYIALFASSIWYALVKTLVFGAYNVILMLALYAAIKIVGVSVFLPLVMMFVFITLMALRSSTFFAWSPYMTVEKRGVFRALISSVALFFKNFSKVFTGYLVMWTVIVSFVLFIGIFTFGIGLVLVIPMFMVLLSILNMTYFYGKNRMRYYVDGKIFDTNLID